MATLAQIDANRANAQHATGPRTAEGKARSAANSFRHGFRSQTVLLPGDDPQEYQGLLDDLTEHFSAADLTELRSVREMADAEWRLRHVRQYQEERLCSTIETLRPVHPGQSPIALQALAFDALHREGPAFAQLLRYETKFERQYERACRTLDTYRGVKDLTRHRHGEMPIPFPTAPHAQPMSQPEQNMPIEPNLPSQPPSPSCPPPEHTDNNAACAAEEHRPCQNEPRKSLETNEQATMLSEQPDPPPPPPVVAQKTPDEPNSPPPRRKTPRNAPCPCRSGLKYKRCCGRGTPAVPDSTPHDRSRQP